MKTRTLIATAAVATLVALGAVATANAGPVPAQIPDGASVCPGFDSGKIDTDGDKASVTVTAPAGKLISGYCVKAGSANQGLPPVFVAVEPPQAEVTITHPSTKDVSHYSLVYVTAPGPTVPDSTVPDSTVPETQPTTTDEVAVLPPTTETSGDSESLAPPAAGETPAASGTPGALPTTGSETTWLAVIALMALLAGGGALIFARRPI
jgi:LPXTG-motif cell wall-anchored protein